VGKLLRVIHTLGFPLDFNGNITRVLGQAIPVAKLGHRVDVLVSNRIPADSLKRAVRSGINVYLLKGLVNAGEIGWRINNTVSLFMKTIESINETSNSILHVAAPTPVFKPLVASEAAKLLKKPIVLDLHDPWSSSPFSHNLALMIQTQIMRRVIKNADYILAGHTQLKKLVEKISRKKPVEVISNGVDTELFKPRPRNTQIARCIGIDEEDLVIAFSGHIMEDKGLDILIQSAPLIRQRHPNVKFLIIGDGPARKSMQDLVQKPGLRNAFVFTGYLPQEMVAEYLSLAHLCVAPYKPAGFFKISLPETPLKAVEYLALGKAVVMSRISDDNVITRSGGGLQVTPGSVNELASTVSSLAEDESLMKTMGEKGRKYVQENLSWQKIAERLIAIYESLDSSA
jgi:glycosyltransferase involved in cell wall biosynthesis